jgi:hypothetical protein
LSNRIGSQILISCVPINQVIVSKLADQVQLQLGIGVVQDMIFRPAQEKLLGNSKTKVHHGIIDWIFG